MEGLIYLISNSCLYDKMICSDAGPLYAKSMNWLCGKIGLDYPSDRILIIDNRIDSNEIKIIRELISRNQHTFVFKLGDGMREACNSDYIRFLFTIEPQKRIYFISPYNNDFLTKTLSTKHGIRYVLTIPYAYNKIMEKELQFPNRRKKILISGSVGEEAYPLRWKLHIETYHKIWALNKVKYLKHPGYADLGFKQQHSYIGDKYLQLLSKYKFMMVSPSVYDYELLKYRECAYAGCCPIGRLSSSISIDRTKIPEEFSLRHNTKQFVEGLFKISEENIFNSAFSFRQWFRDHRNPEKLNDKLIGQILSNDAS